MKNRWLLPEGISDLLPDAAQDLEGLRRAMLDTYRRHGFELVLPPLVEYLDSLLIGSGGERCIINITFLGVITCL